MKRFTRVLGAAAACAVLAIPAGVRAGWIYQQGNGNQDEKRQERISPEETNIVAG